MAKNFPYFKFTVSEWMTGDIVFEDFSTQGLFINICALYWQRDGKLSIEDINKRYKEPIDLPKLSGRFFEVKDGFILIKFLDEQLIDAGHISKVNSDNGKLGGRPRKGEKANGKRSKSDCKPKKSKEEKEEEKELNISFDVFWNLYPVKVAKIKCAPKWEKLSIDERKKIISSLPAFIKNKPFANYNHPNPETYLNQKRWEDEQTSAGTIEETNEQFLARMRKERDEYNAKTDVSKL